MFKNDGIEVTDVYEPSFCSLPQDIIIINKDSFGRFDVSKSLMLRTLVFWVVTLSDSVNDSPRILNI
jgi:hypothetical protein